MNNPTNLGTRTFGTMEGLEDRRLFAASPAALAADLGAPKQDLPAVEVNYGQTLAPRMLGTWQGIFATEQRRVTTVQFIVKSVNGDGSFQSEITFTESDGSQATTVGNGVFYKRGFTLDFNDRKTLAGTMQGRLVDGKGIEATLEYTLAGRKAGGSIAFSNTTDEGAQPNDPAPTASRSSARRPGNIANPISGRIDPMAVAAENTSRVDPTAGVFSSKRIG